MDSDQGRFKSSAPNIESMQFGSTKRGETVINYEIKSSLYLRMQKEKKCGYAHKIRVAIHHSR